MQMRFQIQDQEIRLEVEPEGEGWRVLLPDGKEHWIAATRLPDDAIQIQVSQVDSRLPERLFRIPFARTEQGVSLSYDGQTFHFQPVTDRRSSRGVKAASGALTAPMVGVVAEVMVTEGQMVEAFQPLVAIEAMKVIATLDAPFSGVVQKVHVKKSQRVEHGAVLVEVAPIETAADQS